MAKSEIEKLVTDVCRRFPKAQKKTLARKLHADHPALFPTLERARSAVRFYCGASGSHNRRKLANRSAVRPLGKAGELPPLPESRAVEWAPFTLDARRVLVLSDIHIPWQDAKALDAALEYGDGFSPDAVLINGDLFDFYSISRHEKNPTLPKVSEELLAGGAFFDHLRARYQRARIVFKLGNHDERWAKYIYQAAPLLSDIPDVVNGWEGPARIRENEITVVGDQRPVMLGKLMVLHGHEKGRGLSSPVNPARGAFMRLLCSVLEGHGHRQSEHTEKTADGKHIACWTTGALCDLSPEYARFNKWSHGFAVVTTDKSGEYEVTLKRIIDGKVY